MQMMLDHPEVKAIFCARGGYGTVRIIDRLNFDYFEQHPKWIVGYSDITALHSHIHTQFGIETLHAIMPVNFGEAGSDVAVESLRDVLFGEAPDYHIPAAPLHIEGEARGILTGGNLSILYSLSATSSDIDTEGKILFIEDLDEYLYHIDRMMINLHRAGKLSNLKGLIVGGMSRMNDNKVPFGKNAEEIIYDYASGLNIPVCFGFPAGHQPDNRALILGREVNMSVSQQHGVRVQFVQQNPYEKPVSLVKRMFKPTLYFLGFFLFIYLILSLIRTLI
jgi:muramoyltetrapeptide carboxypeptidase